MRRMATMVAVGIAVSLSVWPQDTAGLAQVYYVKPKPGHTPAFEEAYKGHVEFHRQANDDWAWGAWQVINGDDLGQYIIGTFNHTLAEMDSRGEIDAQDAPHFYAHVDQHCSSVFSRLMLLRADLSRVPAESNPSPMGWVYQYQLKVGADEEFSMVLKKIHEAIEKTDWTDEYVWYQTVNGGEMPRYTLVLPGQKWSDFDGPETPMDEMLKGVYGKTEADQIRAQLEKVTRFVKTSIVQYRPDLSYAPSQ